MGVRYRREDIHFLRRSIESILGQTYSNIEFLICEHNSTSAAKQYLSDLSEEMAKVRLIPGDGADTLAAKLNRCIDAARGDYIARMDDDDLSVETRFTAQLDYLESAPNIAFVGSVAKLERDGQIIGVRRLPGTPQIKDFLFVQPFLHPTLMFRRSVFSSGMRYCEDERCDGCEDYDLLLRLYECGMVGANLQEPYLTYSLPASGCKNRTWKMRLNEVRTRWIRFHGLGLLPKAFPYVVKPLAVGLLPESVLQAIKEKM